MTFVWDHGGSEVFLHVTSNSKVRSSVMLKQDEGHFEVVMELPVGRHEYRSGYTVLLYIDEIGDCRQPCRDRVNQQS